MCYCSKGLDLLKRTLCLFLCVVLLLCFFLVPRAHAVVAEAELAYWGGAIVVSVLAAGGMALATGDAQKVGSAMYAALKDTGGKAWDSIQAMAAWAASAGSKVKDAAFRVGKDVWDAITDCFNKSYSDGSFLIRGNSFTFNADSEDYSSRNKLIDAFNSNKYSTVSVSSSAGVYTLFTTLLERRTDDCRWRFTLVSPSDTTILQEYYGATCSPQFGTYYKSYRFICFTYDADGNISTYSKDYWISAKGDTVVTGYYTYDVSLSDDLVYPGDDYLVKVPDLPAVDTATGAVSWPSDAVYNKDAVAVPYPVDAAGEKVADIPFDVPVDQTTGKDITADTGTDVKPDVKPGEGTDTDTDVKWPTETDLSLPKLIITKFPFCIPFDVARLIGLLEADPKAPVFKVPLKYGAVMDEEITLDLSQFSDAIRIVRWGELILFVAGLAYVTRNYIKW